MSQRLRISRSSTLNGWVSAGPESYALDVLELITRPNVDLADVRNWPPMKGKSLSGYQRKRLFHNVRGETFVDPSRLAAEPEMAATHRGLPYVTVRLAVAASLHFNVTSCLSTIREEHRAFYQRVLDIQTRSMKALCATSRFQTMGSGLGSFSGVG